MLEKARRPGRAKNLVVYLVFGAIILVFIGFGVVPGESSGRLLGAAAVVNRVPVGIVDFQNRYQRESERVSQQIASMPDSIKSEQLARLKAQTLERMISYEVAYQSAEDLGFVAADGEVRDQIVKLPFLQEGGVFRRDYYNRYLQSTGLNAKAFEAKVRKDIVVGKLEQVFSNALRSPSIEKQWTREAQDASVSFKYVAFYRDDLKSKLKVSAQELKDFLAKPEELARTQKYFDENPGRYVRPEELHLRQILILPGNGGEGQKAAMEKVKEVQRRLNEQKEDFAVVARALSQDKATQAKGGDLGWIQRGRMDPKIEEAAFRLEPGAVSEPIQTESGTHIVKLDQRNPSTQRPFAEVRDEIANQLVLEGKIDPWIAGLDDALKSGRVADVEGALKTVGLSWKESGDVNLMSQEVPGLGPSEKVIEEALEQSGKTGVVPSLIRDGGRLIVVKLASLSTKAKDDKMARSFSDYLAARKHIQPFNEWVSGELAKAKIERNEAILQ